MAYSDMYLQQSPYIFKKNTLLSELEQEFKILLSINNKISSQNLFNSFSIYFLYSFKIFKFLLPLLSSFCSMEDNALHAVLFHNLITFEIRRSFCRTQIEGSSLRYLTHFLNPLLFSCIQSCLRIFQFIQLFLTCILIHLQRETF